MEINQINPKADIDKLVIKYVDGRITRRELDELERLLQESEDNLKYYRQIRNMLENNVPVNVNSGHALEQVLERIEKKSKNRNIFITLQRIAAVLFIPLLISFLFFFINNEKSRRNEENSFRTITAVIGTISSFELQDGSRVWLNTGSSLQVPERFSRDQREVKLIGEAYFEVRSDENYPFLVQAGNLSVKATGTRFNVMAYSGGKPSVSLAEGIVAVSIAHENGTVEDIHLLPGQHLIFRNGSQSGDIEEGDVYKYYAWKDGKLVFRNDLLSDIIQRISLQYNVDIEAVDSRILQNRYRATFDKESLSEVLDLLKLASPFSYKEIPPVIQPDGSYSKRKIIISSIKPNL